MSDVAVIHGDMRDVLGKMIAEGKVVQSVVTDPPYHLTSIVKRFGSESAAPAKVGQTGAYARASSGFMGKKWDGGDIAFLPGTWRLCFELLPPGGHLLAFSGTRTYHRMAVAIEEAGFEVRDTIAWLYGSGFPKSHNVSKGIDRAAGAEREVIGPNTSRHGGGTGVLHGGGIGSIVGDITAPATDAARQWDGWGTALKPAMELICVARKPLVGTVAQTVLQHGTGGLNIDGCRVATEELGKARSDIRTTVDGWGMSGGGTGSGATHDRGRWPANVCHDGSDEVVKAFPEANSARASGNPNDPKRGANHVATSYGQGDDTPTHDYRDTGNASRFFYSSKADADDRLGSKHPTIKPVDLMRWLVRLVTPPGGTVLDPFAGSGATGMACMAEGFDCILIEREDEYVKDIRDRIAHVHGEDTPLFSGVML